MGEETPMTIMPNPVLSVYTISFADAGHCADVIRSLQRQSMAAHIELIVVAENGDGLSDADVAAFHSFRLIVLSGLRTIGVAMAAAVRAAHAPHVCYAEEHATFAPEWAEALVSAHGRGYAAVGFAIRNANPDTLTSWAHLYGQFGPAVDPVATTVVPLLTGHHASYAREVLLGYGDSLAAMLEDECAMFLDLRHRGHELLMEGAAVSYHINISRLSAYTRLDFHGQRSFATARAATGHWALWRRLAFALACPLVPFVRLTRILFHLRRSGRFRTLMPQILVPLIPALAAGGVGEAVGYLTGSGAAAERKLGAELRRREFLDESDPLSVPSTSSMT